MFKMMRGQGGKQINVPNNQTLRLKGYRLCGQGAGQRLEGGVAFLDGAILEGAILRGS